MKIISRVCYMNFELQFEYVCRTFQSNLSIRHLNLTDDTRGSA